MNREPTTTLALVAKAIVGPFRRMTGSNARGKATLVRRLPLVLTTAVLAAAIPGVARGAKESAAAAIEFRGYFQLREGSNFVSLASKDGAAKWVPVGGRWDGHWVREFDRQKQQVTIEGPDGARRILDLAAAQIVRGSDAPQPAQPAVVRLPAPPGDRGRAKAVVASEVVSVFPPIGVEPSLEGLDWDWIESDANPMRKMATLPSMEETRKWPSLTPQERDDLIELYRQCGWGLRVYILSNGGTSGDTTRLTRPGARR